MKTAKNLAAMLLAALMVASLAGCAGTGSETPTAAPAETATESTAEPTGAPEESAPSDDAVKVTDMTGREVTIEAPAERIVALTASDCEIIYALGSGAKLVGRGEYCDYPAEVLEVASVQSGSETNVEQIIALEPDVVFTSAMDQDPAQVAQLEAAGIAVVESYAQDIEGVYTAITLIGKALGCDAEAAAIVDNMKATFEAVQTDAAAANEGANEEKTIYFEVSPLEYGLWTAGNGSFMNEIASLMGLTNIFADVDGWGEVSEEQVIERDPDYIVTISMYYGEGPTPVEEIAARAGWENMTAVKNGAILNLANNELSRPAPRLAEGAKLLYEFVYVTMAQEKAA